MRAANLDEARFTGNAARSIVSGIHELAKTQGWTSYHSEMYVVPIEIGMKRPEDHVRPPGTGPSGYYTTVYEGVSSTLVGQLPVGWKPANKSYGVKHEPADFNRMETSMTTNVLSAVDGVGYQEDLAATDDQTILPLSEVEIRARDPALKASVDAILKMEGGADAACKEQVAVSSANALTALSQALQNAATLVACGQHSSDKTCASQVDRMVEFGVKTAKSLMKTLAPIAQIPDTIASNVPEGWGSLTTAQALKIINAEESGALLRFPEVKYPRAEVPDAAEGSEGEENAAKEATEDSEDDDDDGSASERD